MHITTLIKLYAVLLFKQFFHKTTLTGYKLLRPHTHMKRTQQWKAALITFKGGNGQLIKLK